MKCPRCAGEGVASPGAVRRFRRAQPTFPPRSTRSARALRLTPRHDAIHSEQKQTLGTNGRRSIENRARGLRRVWPLGTMRASFPLPQGS